MTSFFKFYPMLVPNGGHMRRAAFVCSSISRVNLFFTIKSIYSDLLSSVTRISFPSGFNSICFISPSNSYDTLKYNSRLSLSFRLFGNVFAGEVLLSSIAVILAYGLPIPFMFLEILVGFIQALIFGMLTLVYFTIAAQTDDH